MKLTQEQIDVLSKRYYLAKKCYEEQIQNEIESILAQLSANNEFDENLINRLFVLSEYANKQKDDEKKVDGDSCWEKELSGLKETKNKYGNTHERFLKYNRQNELNIVLFQQYARKLRFCTLRYRKIHMKGRM